MTLCRNFAIGLLIASLAACAPWKRVDSSSQVETKGDDYSLELPLGWVRHTATANDFFVTRDGPALNHIVVNRQAHDKKLPNTKRETRADLLPHEIAEWKRGESTATLGVISNAPVLLGGKPAVRVHARFKMNAACRSIASWSP